jgi:hypothetical protein
MLRPTNAPKTAAQMAMYHDHGTQKRSTPLSHASDPTSGTSPRNPAAVR